ncbi:hypothetical protein ASD50_15550 [Mesorhizobium sp. Root552]|nr:hypothetical protein ASD50_15550 [Mesorhizobium sp. Root552]
MGVDYSPTRTIIMFAKDCLVVCAVGIGWVSGQIFPRKREFLSFLTSKGLKEQEASMKNQAFAEEFPFAQYGNRVFKYGKVSGASPEFGLVQSCLRSRP